MNSTEIGREHLREEGDWKEGEIGYGWRNNSQRKYGEKRTPGVEVPLELEVEVTQWSEDLISIKIINSDDVFVSNSSDEGYDWFIQCSWTIQVTFHSAAIHLINCRKYLWSCQTSNSHPILTIFSPATSVVSSSIVARGLGTWACAASRWLKYVEFFLLTWWTITFIWQAESKIAHKMNRKNHFKWHETVRK